MKQGGHAKLLPKAIGKADVSFAYCADLNGIEGMPIYSNPDLLLQDLLAAVKPGDVVLFMSNKGFAGLQTQFQTVLKQVTV